jgi:hypothetical protein
MKKIIMLCSAIFLLVLSTKAQTFAFYKGDAPLENNAEFTVSKTSLDEFGGLVIESGLSLKNLTHTEVNARATQTVLTTPRPSDEDGILNFCFDRCQEGNADQTQTRLIDPDFLMVPPEFHLCYFPFGENYTTVQVRYEVFPMSNIQDRTSVTVTYNFNQDSQTGLNSPKLTNTISAFQEGNQVKFKYGFDSEAIQLEVYDVVGHKVAHYPLDSKWVFILPEELTKGIYIYTVRNNNKQLATHKLIVQ